ncbi:O-methyltransferase [Amycolatopsis sp. NPDC003731]
MAARPINLPAVDQYVDRLFSHDLSAPVHILEGAQQLGLPHIHVSPSEGRLLWLLTKLCQAKTVLEVGTLAGYSTWWFTQALPPDGRIVTIEGNPLHAQLARDNLGKCEIALSSSWLIAMPGRWRGP